MPFWIQRALSKIAYIARFHCHVHIESHGAETLRHAHIESHGAETLWFIKVLCTICIFRASTNLSTFICCDYFRNSLNPFVAFRVIQQLSDRYNNPRLAFSFFQCTRLGLNIVHPVSTYNWLLRSLCQMGCQDSAKLVFDYMNTDGYLCDSLVLEMLVSSFANAGKFEFSKEVLVSQAEVSNEKGRIISPFVYNDFMNLLVKLSRVKEAVDFFRDHVLRLQSFSPDTSSFNIIIRGLCCVREVDKAFQFFEYMGSFGCFPDIITYNSLINGLSKVGNVDRAKALLTEMQSKGEVPPDVVSYTSVISGCCKLGKMEEAASVLDEMVTFGVRPNSFTFNALIDGFGKSGDMISALKIHQRMLLLGCPSDVVTYTSLINGHCQDGDLDQGLKLWCEMDAKKLYPNLHTFSVLINALCKENRLAEARNLLTQLLARDDIVPQPFIYNPVIDGFCKAGKIDEANIIVAEMEAKRCHPDKLTFTILILGHCMKGRMFEAIDIYRKMLAVGCAPDRITINSLVSCLLKAGMAGEAYKIKQTAYESMHSCSSSKRSANTKSKVEFPVAV